jgi:hypothetical protein
MSETATVMWHIFLLKGIALPWGPGWTLFRFFIGP